MNVATLEEPLLDAGRTDAAGRLNGAVRMVAQALGAPCELVWPTETGELARVCSGCASLTAIRGPVRQARCSCAIVTGSCSAGSRPRQTSPG
jgi:hypothetical protein